MKLILVRHAQTLLNASGVYQGQGVNPPLDEVGIQQARQLALKLEEMPIDVSYTSDLTRAWSTAHAILYARRNKFQIRFAKELRERNLGSYEGKRIDSGIYQRDFEASGLSFADFAPPNGESWRSLQLRMVTFFTKLTSLHPEEYVLMVSHGGSISALLIHLLGKDLNRENQVAQRVDNTSVSILNWDCHRNALENVETMNDTAHTHLVLN